MVLHCVLVVLVGIASLSPVSAAQDPITPGWPCPIYTEISPCVCFQDTEYNLYMDCSLATSDEQLERIFSATFPFKDFYELKIIHDPEDVTNVIDEINANTFAEIEFERIIITGTRLVDIIDEAFADSHNSLQYLDLSNNYLQTFPFESLALYTELNTFIIDDNQFPVLYDLESESLEMFSANRNPNLLMNSDSLFTGVPSLRELYLSEIGLTELRVGLFNNLTQLQVVDFSKNHITELEKDAVSIAGRTLKTLNFDINEISFVRHDALVGMMDNATLSMAENNIQALDEEQWGHIFQQITYRESIDLRGNPLICGCDIDWLFMQYEEEYLCRLTDTTLCFVSLEQVIFLDVNIYCDQCADSFIDCPPETDCKNPSVTLS